MKRNIAKILTLYKQHYREKYSYELDTEYSCFGYYDGLDISEVENEKNRLSLSKGSINITDTWFGILNMAGKPKLVNGSNSQQNFVLFYTDNESDTENNEELFWKEDQAFLAVMFVQLKGNENQGLNDYINAIRRFIVEEYGNNDCKIISYRLIDNADFLLVIKGNSYIKISNIVREIQNIKSIIYVNTIFSVHSKYLKGSVLKEDETLEGVRLEISAKEEGAVSKLVKKIEEELYLQGISSIAGIDEAGRGPLAGPVVVACVMMSRDSMIEGVNDSKKVSEKKREKLYEEIIKEAIRIWSGNYFTRRNR